MLTLEIYFDESGHGDDPKLNFFGIVGCLEKAEAWTEFEGEWDAVLKAEGLPYFHMNEFAQSTGIFKGWRKNEVRRRKVYGDLWKIIHKVEPVVVGCFVDLQGYRGALGQTSRDIVGDVYYLCYLHCLKVVSTLVINDSRSNVPINKFATIFDDKKGFIGKAMGIYENIINRFPDLREMVPPPIFRDMRKVNPIQVADIIAYESYKEFNERSKESGRMKKRWGFEQLENLLSSKANRNDFAFGDTRSPFAFYSQYELARMNVAYKKQFSNKELE